MCLSPGWGVGRASMCRSACSASSASKVRIVGSPASASRACISALSRRAWLSAVPLPVGSSSSAARKSAVSALGSFKPSTASTPSSLRPSITAALDSPLPQSRHVYLTAALLMACL